MDQGTLIVVVVVVVFVVLYICRELSCWYFKINERVRQNDEIIKLLKKGHQPTKDTSNPEPPKESATGGAVPPRKTL